MHDAGPPAGKLDRIINRLTRRMTPPKLSIRSRRGASPPELLEGVAGGAQAPEPERTDSWRQQQSESARATTLRKREKIAELRRRRQQDLEQRRQSQYSAMSPVAAIAPGAANLAALAAAVSPLGPGAAGQPLFLAPQSARRDQACLAEDQFFDSPELNLLLSPIDIDSMVGGVGSSPPSRQTPARRHNPRPTAHDELDFTIDIPSTSLSPVVPLGRGHGRQRSRAAMPVAGRGAPAAGPAASRRMHQQIDEELARNRALRRELARLDDVVQALEKLAPAVR
ncbi:hypothetical protein IWQ56_002426 [Coemansia nantahalensis]|nr:hypothetical protein IWQ56_002426 [Coemansia nantahalensis]